MTYIINIVEIPSQTEGEDIHPEIEHYRRRVEMPDINAVVDRLDAALKVKARKPRSDAGQKRKEQP